MTSPEPLSTVVIPTVPRVKFNDVVMALCVVLMGAALYMLWRSDRRAVESDATFRDAVHTLKDKVSAGPTDTGRANGFNPGACSSECAEGHTYRVGCVQYVEHNEQQTGTL